MRLNSAITCLVLLAGVIQLPYQAHAEWRMVTVEDDFDGSKRSRISTHSTNGKIALSFWSDKDGLFNLSYPSLQLALGSGYICNVSDRGSQHVEWIVAKEDGEIAAQKRFSPWKVSRDRTGLIVDNDDYMYRNKTSPGREIMTAARRQGTELRIRFTDACGEVYTARFNTAGLHELINSAPRRQY